MCSYFQNTYIEKNLREPLFPPSIWNKREAASERVPRTTNAVEGWHFGFQAFFSGSHPSLWRTLENLKKDAATQKYLYLQSTAGTEFSRRKKYRELEAKVKNAIERHQDVIIRTISGFFPSPPHPIPIFQVPDIGNLGKSGFQK